MPLQISIKKIYNGIARFLCHSTAFLSYISDRSNDEITHSTLIFTAVA